MSQPRRNERSDTCVAYLLDWGAAELAEVVTDSRREALWLLSYASGRTTAQLVAYPEFELTQSHQLAYRTAVNRRRVGEPLAYITGSQEFWSLPLQVTPDTLIPRADTEILVEQVLSRVPTDAAWRIADLGTGSGAVALAIARERPSCQLVASDRYLETLRVAHHNAQSLAIANVAFIQGDWLAPWQQASMDMIVSNPPYIRPADPHLQQDGLNFEPQTALIADGDGLACLRTIAAQARNILKSGGYLLMEHGFDQGDDCRDLLTQCGFENVDDIRDYGGQARVIVGRLP